MLPHCLGAHLLLVAFRIASHLPNGEALVLLAALGLSLSDALSAEEYAVCDSPRWAQLQMSSLCNFLGQRGFPGRAVQWHQM